MILLEVASKPSIDLHQVVSMDPVVCWAFLHVDPHKKSAAAFLRPTWTAEMYVDIAIDMCLLYPIKSTSVSSVNYIDRSIEYPLLDVSNLSMYTSLSLYASLH
jgi:hypothetical protein